MPTCAYCHKHKEYSPCMDCMMEAFEAHGAPKPKLILMIHSSGYQGYYKGDTGTPAFGRKPDDDPVSLLKCIAENFPDGFVMEYGEHLSDDKCGTDFS